MAQLLRQRLGSLMLRRSTPVPPKQNSTSTFSSAAHHENAEETVKWRNVTIAGYVTCFLLGVYIFTGEGHGHESRPAYSYLRIRNKEFPWGPDGLLEQNHEDHH